MILVEEQEGFMSRWAFNPIDISPNSKLELSNLCFKSSNDGHGKHFYEAESINWSMYLSEPNEIHELGIYKQKIDNLKKVSEGREDLRTYLGYGHTKITNITSLKVDTMYFLIEHCAEPLGDRVNEAHCNLHMKYTEAKPNKALRNLVLNKIRESFLEGFVEYK